MDTDIENRLSKKTDLIPALKDAFAYCDGARCAYGNPAIHAYTKTNMDKPKTELIGTWQSDPNDPSGNQEYGRVTLNFGADGTLLYTVHERDKDQIMRLRYTVDEEFVVTSQPSKPRIEKTRYELTPDGKLLLAFDGQTSRYVRAI